MYGTTVLFLLSLFVVQISCDVLFCPLTAKPAPGHLQSEEKGLCGESGNEKHVYHVLKRRDLTASDFLENATETTSVTTGGVGAFTTKSPILEHTTLKAQTTTDKNIDPDSFGDDSHEGYNTTFDHHRYYQSFSRHGADLEEYWVDLDTMDQDVVLHEKLSNAHRRALMVNLSFAFPFYGHMLRNITIATGGFIYTGTFVHKWLAATQYIAPLMANFDTSTSSEATVKYYDNGTSLTVQWGNVILQDNPEYGRFTFQVTLKDSGKIIFAYKEIPVNTSLIKDDAHPVKIGLSDAYIVEKIVFFVRKKTIYEYHKIDKKEYHISNKTAIIFEPVKNCVQYQTCESCLLAKTTFQCKWCQQVGRCSDSVDRYRQDWFQGGCSKNAVSNSEKCTGLEPVIPKQEPTGNTFYPPQTHVVKTSSHVGTVILVTILLIVMCFAAWLYYAYYHPHTTSGQILIKYRPSRWSLMRGGAKYTAATMHSIHM